MFKIINERYLPMTIKLANTSIKYIFYNDPCENIIYLRPKTEYLDDTEINLERSLK